MTFNSTWMHVESRGHRKPSTLWTHSIIHTQQTRAACVGCAVLTRGSGWYTGDCSVTTWAGRCRTGAVETWRKVVSQLVHSHYRCHHAESQSCDIKAHPTERAIKVSGAQHQTTYFNVKLRQAKYTHSRLWTAIIVFMWRCLTFIDFTGASVQKKLNTNVNMLLMHFWRGTLVLFKLDYLCV